MIDFMLRWGRFLILLLAYSILVCMWGTVIIPVLVYITTGDSLAKEALRIDNLLEDEYIYN